MNTSQLVISDEPALEVKNEHIFASSVEIAQKFGKRHWIVIRAIEKLVASGRFTEHNFVSSKYQDSTGRNLPFYMMDRHGFSILVMGFTGNAALDWKIKYDRAFEKMATELMNQQVARIDYLPGYHDLHEIVDKQAAVAAAKGSRLTRRLAHINTNKMLNKCMGISSGQRSSLSSMGRSAISMAQTIANAAIKNDLESGGDHKTSYAAAKKAVGGYAAHVPGEFPMLMA